MFFKNTFKYGILLIISLPIGYGVMGFILGILFEGQEDVIDWARLIDSVAMLDKSMLIRDSLFTLRVTVLSTLLSIFICYILALYAFKTNRYFLICLLMTIIFIIPHPTFAILFEQVLSESSLLRRSIFLFQSNNENQLPNPSSLFNHSSGIGYIIALALKEAPFLWFILLASSFTHAYQQQIKVAQSLGYDKSSAVVFLIYPQMYKHLRMPLLTVVIFVTGHVEMALLIAPFTPETLGIKILTLYNEANVVSRQQAFILGAWLIVLSILCVIIVQLIIFCFRQLAGLILHHGIRLFQLPLKLIAYSAPVLIFLKGCMLVIGFVTLLLLSFATYWPFPDILPESLTVIHWQEVLRLSMPLILNSIVIATTAVFFSLVIVVTLIEITYKSRLANIVGFILLFPLLIPMLGFLLGLLLLMNRIHSISPFFPVILGHMLYIMPYFYFILIRPFNEFDKRWIYASNSLGKSTFYSYFKIKLRFMFTPLLFTLLLGFIVSFNQYLPTLLLGGGYIETLNSQAIIFALGGSKRLLASFALLQMMLALFTLLLGIFLWGISRERKLFGKMQLGL